MQTDMFTVFVYCNFLVLLRTVCRQNINKQIVNIADQNPADYSFLRRFHNTKSVNYLKRRYRIRHWISSLLGHPVDRQVFYLQIDWTPYNGNESKGAK